MVYSNNATSLGLKTGMELRFLLLLLLLFYISGFQAQEHVAVESRVEGQSLSVECRYYAQDYSNTRKTWCQMRDEICSPLVSTFYTSSRRYQNKGTSGRATIVDDTRDGIVTITMEELQVQDSGVYSCALIVTSNRVYRWNTIKLNVYKAVQEHTAMEGQSLSVQCPYNTQDYKEAKKAWCRKRVQNECDVLVNTYNRMFSYQNKIQKGISMIQDDTHKGVVTITMEKLQVDDSGVYWCRLYDPPSIYQIIEVKLDVIKAPTTSDVPVTPSTGHTSPVLSTAGTELIPTGSSQHPSANTFIILSVVLGLLFILALIGLVVLCIRKPRQLKSRGDGQAEDIYEEPRNAPESQGFHDLKDPKDDKQEMPQDLNYVTLDFKSRSSPKDSVYANIIARQGLETPHTRSPSVEYASISLKPLASAAQQ